MKKIISSFLILLSFSLNSFGACEPQEAKLRTLWPEYIYSVYTSALNNGMSGKEIVKTGDQILKMAEFGMVDMKFAESILKTAENYKLGTEERASRVSPYVQLAKTVFEESQSCLNNSTRTQCLDVLNRLQKHTDMSVSYMSKINEEALMVSNDFTKMAQELFSSVVENRDIPETLILNTMIAATNSYNNSARAMPWMKEEIVVREKLELEFSNCLK
ncbi:hypothetical protein ACJVC5_11360 [Peredibacter sp. HCB2-198]|uniref:hypothetical protein n=1 Tax=Peredibacter sp. HCB2-198 TaxID=3383025 RepID=UPI0038B4F6DD